MSSTFEVPIIPVILEPHPNAETLSIVRYQGYQIVVKTEEFKDVKKAAFIPPDSVVPNTPEWAWLGTESRHRRIKVQKFRGEWSHGLLYNMASRLIPTDDPRKPIVGTNVAEDLGITPYESPSSSREGNSSRNRRQLPWYRRIFSYYKELRERPKGRFPYYDVENLRKLPNLFQAGEPVLVTEKIHGANALYTSKRPWYSRNTKIYMRSRTMWKHPSKNDWWQDAYRATPGIEQLLQDFPGISIYGEVYGPGVQELGYGISGVGFVGFDLWDQQAGYLNQEYALTLMAQYKIPTVSCLYNGPFVSNQHILELVDDFKHSRLALNNGVIQISEGVVVQKNVIDEGRKILKVVSDLYLSTVKD